jgi:Domain of unknown function (DUF4189)
MALMVPSLALGAAQALAADYYGAIAFSPDTGSVGYSYNYGTRNGAENRALAECGRRDCVAVIWFRNACGALATGDGNGYGYAWAVTRAEAEDTALNQCNRYTTNCAYNTWACTAR